MSKRGRGLLGVQLDRQDLVHIDGELLPHGLTNQLRAELLLIFLDVGDVEGHQTLEVILKKRVGPGFLLQGDDE